MEMSLDIEKFKEIQRLLIQRDKQRLELIIQNKVKVGKYAFIVNNLLISIFKL